jgi:para-nitrobenzyl esterase
LKTRTPAQLLDALNDPSLKKGPGAFGDDVVLPTDLPAAFEQGHFRHMPTIVGMTRDEAKLFMAGAFKIDNAQRFSLMLNANPDALPRAGLQDIISPYLLPRLGPFLYDTYASTVTALLLREVRSSASMLAKYEPRVFVYRFDWDQGPEPWKTVYGASHAIDLPFIFGNFSRNFFAMDFSEKNRPGREALSLLMMRSIGAFVRTGNPNTAELQTTWPAWSATDGAGQKLIWDASANGAAVSVQ